MAKTSTLTNLLSMTVTEGLPDGAGTVKLVCKETDKEDINYFLPTLEVANTMKTNWDD